MSNLHSPQRKSGCSKRGSVTAPSDRALSLSCLTWKLGARSWCYSGVFQCAFCNTDKLRSSVEFVEGKITSFDLLSLDALAADNCQLQGTREGQIRNHFWLHYTSAVDHPRFIAGSVAIFLPAGVIYMQMPSWIFPPQFNRFITLGKKCRDDLKPLLESFRNCLVFKSQFSFSSCGASSGCSFSCGLSLFACFSNFSACCN